MPSPPRGLDAKDVEEAWKGAKSTGGRRRSGSMRIMSRRSCRVIALAALVIIVITHYTGILSPSSTTTEDATRHSTAGWLATGFGRNQPARGKTRVKDEWDDLGLDSSPSTVDSQESFTPSRTEVVETEEADEQFCGAKSCKALVPAWISEDEANAQMHLLQLQALATALGRTLVLPNVHRSRMGTCLSTPFDVYYDKDVGNEDSTPLPNAVTFEKFRHWVASRQAKPTAQVVLIKTDPLSNTTIADSAVLGAEASIDAVADPISAGRQHCLVDKTPRLLFQSYSPLTLRPIRSKGNESWHESVSTSHAFGSGIAQMLQDKAQGPAIGFRTTKAVGKQGVMLANTAPPPDVLILNWEIEHPVFNITVPIVPPLAYAPRWTKLASSLASKLSPFIAVHWRMEGVPQEALPGCAKKLTTVLDDVLNWEENEDVGTVWFATDYPLDGASRASSSFTASPEASAAIKDVQRSFAYDGPLERWRLTTLSGEFSRSGEDMDAEDDAFDQDPGLLAIIDKHVAMMAAVFVSSGKGCGLSRSVHPVLLVVDSNRRPSSFTRHIVQTRSATYRSQPFEVFETNAGLRNVAEYFSDES